MSYTVTLSDGTSISQGSGGRVAFRKSSKTLASFNRSSTSSNEETSLSLPEGSAKALVGISNLSELSSAASSYEDIIQQHKSAAQVIQSALSGISTMSRSLEGMRDTLQALKNQSLSTTHRDTLEGYFNDYKDDYVNALISTGYKDTQILNGGLSDFSLQIGPNSDDTITLNIDDLSLSALNIDNLTFDDLEETGDSLSKVKTALRTINSNTDGLASAKIALTKIGLNQEYTDVRTSSEEILSRNIEFVSDKNYRTAQDKVNIDGLIAALYKRPRLETKTLSLKI